MTIHNPHTVILQLYQCNVPLTPYFGIALPNCSHRLIDCSWGAKPEAKGQELTWYRTNSYHAWAMLQKKRCMYLTFQEPEGNIGILYIYDIKDCLLNISTLIYVYIFIWAGFLGWAKVPPPITPDSLPDYIHLIFSKILLLCLRSWLVMFYR